MLSYTDFFSRKVAKGKAFFDRQDQRRKLTIDLSSSSSVWLAGERRVGKTSAAIHVCSELEANPSQYGINHFAWSECDISSCATIEATKRQILHTIADAAGKITGNSKKAIELLKSAFARFDPELSVGGSDIAKLTLKLKSISAEDSLQDAIIALDGLAKKQNSKAVIIIDEFQTLAEIEQATGERIEWDIRAGLQHSDNVCMVFAGSKKRMMSEVFLNKSRGLYGMCRRINIFELPKDDCIAHLTLASKQCGYTFDAKALEMIVDITSGHPRDFSHLSLQVFEDSTFDNVKPKHISTDTVINAWDTYIKDVVIDEVSSLLKEKLNNNKRAEISTIQAIAHTRPRTNKIRTAKFAMLVGLSTTPIVGAIKNLEEQGLIRIVDERWSLCEPSYEESLKQISKYHFDPALIEAVKILSEQ